MPLLSLLELLLAFQSPPRSGLGAKSRSSTTRILPTHRASTVLGLAPDPVLFSHVTSAATVAAAGDLVAQRTDSNKNNAPGIEWLDAKRAFAFTLFGATYTGGFQHFLFEYLMSPETAQSILALPVVTAAVAAAGAQYAETVSSLVVTVGRMFLNQFVAIPLLYYPFFFLISATVRGERPLIAAVVNRARKVWARALLANWRFWVPCQLIQFALVPKDLQVPYCLACGVAWNTLLSRLDAKETAKNSTST